MNTIQGVLLLSGRGASAPSLALRLQEGENLCAVKLTATLRRSIGLLWRRDGYRRAAARAFSALPPVLLKMLIVRVIPNKKYPLMLDVVIAN